MSSYPLFVPPDPLGSRTPHEWTSREAKQYAEWLLQEIPHRLEDLLSFLAVDSAQPADVLLEDAGSKAAALLRDPTFSGIDDQGRVVLTNAGYALAADMGLLVADLIVRAADGATRWEVLKRPKAAAAYHLPVLSTPRLIPFEPVGASIGQAHGILRNERSPSIWREMYQSRMGKLRATADDG